MKHLTMYKLWLSCTNYAKQRQQQKAPCKEELSTGKTHFLKNECWTLDKILFPFVFLATCSC